MSYLQVPRLHFFGTFRASPSTINNVDANWDPTKAAHPLWNPRGTHEFQLLRGNEVTIPLGAPVTPCTITSVCGPDGQYTTSDPIVGKFVISTNSPSTAKLVDLDVDQQGVSEIWGMEIGIGDPNGDCLSATFETIFFRQLFNPRNTAPLPGTMPYSAAYQSVLSAVQWPSTLTSQFLRDLRDASPDLLSICFTVDDYSPVALGPGGVPNPRFNLGRVTGTIGPATRSEPRFYPGPGRLLRPPAVASRESADPTPQMHEKAARMKANAGVEVAPPAASREAISNPDFNYAWAFVDAKRSKAVIDLGNSLQFEGAAPGSVGELTAAIVTSAGPVTIGTIDNSLENYRQRAWIFEFPLTSDQLEDTKSNPLAILVEGVSALSENATGAFVEATDHVVRMDANTATTIGFRATTFGALAPAGTKIAIGPPQPGDGVVTFTPAVATIGADGAATVKITAGNPGNARPFIDGQVYDVPFVWSQDTNRDINAVVSVKVYSAFAVPATPKWSDVQPIFQQLMHLYPSMQTILNLADEQTVRSNAALIRQYMAFPTTSPRFMPVTRDLSGPKTKMILEYLDSL